MSDEKRGDIPDGARWFSDEEFASSTERVRAIRRKALEDPAFAAAVEAKLAAIDRQVHDR